MSGYMGVLAMGRIGVAKRIHQLVVLERISNGTEWWAISWCGWAGLCELTPGQPRTCEACLKLWIDQFDTSKRQKESVMKKLMP